MKEFHFYKFYQKSLQNSYHPYLSEALLKVGWLWWSLRWCQVTHNIHRKFSWMFYQDQRSGTSSSLNLSSKSLPGFLEDMDVLDGDGDCVRVLILSIIGFPESFIKSRSNNKNLTKSPPILQVPSWSHERHWCSWWSWRWCQGNHNIHKSFPESFIKVQDQEAYQESTYPPSPFLESWRTWMIVMEHEMESGY